VVDRCVCSDRTFAEMKTVIDTYELSSVDQLRGYMEFGKNCALCVPYIRRVFATGKTEFDIIISGENTQ
jgi:bacterioferritin-associated ferredoxin